MARRTPGPMEVAAGAVTEITQSNVDLILTQMFTDDVQTVFLQVCTHFQHGLYIGPIQTMSFVITGFELLLYKV